MTLPVSSSLLRHEHFIRTSVAGTQPKCGFANGIHSLSFVDAPEGMLFNY